MLLVCGAAVRGAPFAAQRLHPKFQRMDKSTSIDLFCTPQAGFISKDSTT